MSCDNLTAILYKINDIRLEKRPIPEPKDDEVLLKMGSVGICGSDVHYLEFGRIADFVVKEPMIMGHEAGGTVVKIGPKVTNLKIGDRVAIEPGVPCRFCDNCKQGRYNMCPGMIFCATPPVHGNLSQYYTHPADFCYRLPDNVSLEEGALLEPLSVGVHACRRAGVGISSTVLILGSGPIGLVTILTAKFMGAMKIICVDILEHKLQMAKDCGADYVLKINPKASVEDVSKQIQDLLGGPPDKSIDCAGFESTVNIALKVTRESGTVVIVGMGQNEMKIPLSGALTRELDIRGSFRYCNDYPLALAMVASGLNVKQLITHRFRLEETEKAFETAQKGTGNPIKIMIKCND